MINRSQVSPYRRGLGWWAGRILMGGAAVTVGLVLTTSLSGAVARANLAKQFPPPGRLVDVNGHKMHLNCLGEGSPTVIMEAGLGDYSIFWGQVQPEVARFTQVCVYDRAGFGWSETGPQPRTSETIVAELHTLLANAGVEKPYLLVGHSFGGLNMRLYAHHYPDEVVGLVLVDSMHEEQDTRLPAYGKANEQLVKQFRLLALLRKIGIVALFPDKVPNPGFPDEVFAQYGAIMATTRYFETSNAERLALARSLAEYRAANVSNLGDLPLIFLSRGLWTPVQGLTDTGNKRNEQIWQEMQSELAALSTNSQQIIAEKSDHSIQLQQPELVVAAIRQLYDAGREF